ncbi:unnamed protein product [Auanema sp. JU1783]|nr:unnamed protein product [Auanema sp. JU1783]
MRFGRAKCCRLLFLAGLTSLFIIFTNHYKESHFTYAKAIEPRPEPRVEETNIDDDPRVNLDNQIGNLKPLPIVSNEADDGIDIARVDGFLESQSLKINRKPPVLTNEIVNGQKYPVLNTNGNFIPQRRVIHLDLKGAPYKPEFFTELFYFFKRIHATGILIEWEDMFPYTGVLAEAVNGNAYSMEDIESILQEARRHRLDIIPLVQTFGHLEWILKLEPFQHLREDVRFPQVICFPLSESWKLITEMIDQVASVHKKYGMPYFHMGADEVFQIGVCNASVKELGKQGSRDRLALWHISRTASHIKETHNTTVLAWHDMFAQAFEADIMRYNLTNLLEPVLWSYAEDLDMYLPYSTWNSLKPFNKVWGSSAWKGADGPARYNSNPIHYIKNHQSWTTQFTRVYKEFSSIQGLIMTGWSRYDHLAVLAELLPVALPTLSMSMETIMEARVLNQYPLTYENMNCRPAVEMGVTRGCQFPGKNIYEIVNEYYRFHNDLKRYQDDYELNGWLSRVADSQLVSSRWYIDKIQPMIEDKLERIKELASRLRFEMEKIYFSDTIDEFIYTYMGDDLEWLKKKTETIEKMLKAKYFPKRPLKLDAI